MCLLPDHRLKVGSQRDGGCCTDSEKGSKTNKDIDFPGKGFGIRLNKELINETRFVKPHRPDKGIL